MMALAWSTETLRGTSPLSGLREVEGATPFEPEAEAEGYEPPLFMWAR
jgi:hypothetical protein